MVSLEGGPPFFVKNRLSVRNLLSELSGSSSVERSVFGLRRTAFQFVVAYCIGWFRSATEYFHSPCLSFRHSPDAKANSQIDVRPGRLVIIWTTRLILKCSLVRRSEERRFFKRVLSLFCPNLRLMRRFVVSDFLPYTPRIVHLLKHFILFFSAPLTAGAFCFQVVTKILSF